MGRRRIEQICPCLSDTHLLGQKIGSALPQSAIVAFYAPMGVGKTAFIQGIIHAIYGSHVEVCSPTFTLMHCYSHQDTKLYHFDLYRLQDSTIFRQRGLEDYLYEQAICCIEWACRIQELLPPTTISIHGSLEGTDRKFVIEYLDSVALNKSL